MAHPLAMAFVSAAFVLSFILLSLACIMLYRGRRSSVDPERGTTRTAKADLPETPAAATTQLQFKLAETGDRLHQFKWTEIVTLTDNFAPNSVIGEGGFSTVYLASIPSSPTTLVALKVNHHSGERLRRAFRRELDVLLRLRHPHIIRTLGYCFEDDIVDSGGAIALEYVSGGTLHGRLHGSGSGTAALPWAHRMLIARQVAAAVEYLHCGCDPQVVHGDIKAANVMLDGGPHPNAKLCDFGSARVGFTAAVLSATGKEERGIMVGSPGYVDPNYVRTGMVSKGSDVYSFGVLLLELVTGGRPYCTESQQLLTARVLPLLRDGKLQVDTILGCEYDMEEAAAAVEVAAKCVREQPSLRPAIGEVLRILTEKSLSSSFSAIHDKELNRKLDSSSVHLYQ